MFKVLLIVYFLGGGGAVKDHTTKGTTFNTSFTFQEFYSMEDCEAVRTKMKEMSDVWHWGDDMENKITSLYSTSCVSMTAKNEPIDPPPKTAVPPPETTKHERWDR